MAIPTLCVGMLAVAVTMIVLIGCGCVPNGKGEDTIASSKQGQDEGQDEEKESLVRGGKSNDE